MTVSLCNDHNDGVRNLAEAYRLYRVMGGPRDGAVVAALVHYGGRPVEGVQSLSVVDTVRQHLTRSCFTLRSSGRAPEAETVYGNGTIVPLTDAEVRELGF